MENYLPIFMEKYLPFTVNQFGSYEYEVRDYWTEENHYPFSVSNFSKPSENGINLNGLYRISRNPMYVSYLIYFLGCVLITQSLLLLAILVVFQISTHWIILSEERWCVNKVGEEYKNYMSKVRRYI